jgi:hypothetical protein
MRFAAAQSVADCQVQDCEIASAAGLGAIDRTQELRHVIPRQGAREALQAIDPRSVDLLVQRAWQYAPGVLTAQISPQIIASFPAPK